MTLNRAALADAAFPDHPNRAALLDAALAAIVPAVTDSLRELADQWDKDADKQPPESKNANWTRMDARELRGRLDALDAEARGQRS